MPVQGPLDASGEPAERAVAPKVQIHHPYPRPESKRDKGSLDRDASR
jgi:hypothetical protein